MARSITFNGITRFKPGGITKVNAEALNQVLLGDNAIVALIGEADGGAPGSEVGLQTLFDSSDGIPTYRSGALANAIRLAFQSSADPDILAGASRVLVWKTNDSTKATLSLPSKDADHVVGTDASPATVENGTTTTIEDSIDLVGFVDDELNGMWVILEPFTADAEARRIVDFDADSNTLTVDEEFSSAPSGGEDYLVLEDEVEALDVIDSGSSTTTVLAIEGSELSFTDDEHDGRWAYIVDAADTSVAYLRKITATDGTADTITITPALPSVPEDGSYLEVLPNAVDLESVDWGSHTNGIEVEPQEGSTPDLRQVSVLFEGEEEASSDLGGTVYMHLLYRGAGSDTTDTVDATADSTATTIELTTGGLTAGDEVGKQVLINGEYTTITANDTDQLTVSPALSAAPSSGDDVVITTLTDSKMEVSGSSGKATGLSTTLVGVTGDDLAIQFQEGQTVRQLVNDINSNPNYLATIPTGVNPDTALVADFDFGPDTEVTIHNSFDLDKTAGLKQDLKAVVDYFNEFSDLVEATRATDDGSAVAGCCKIAAFDPAVVLGAEDPFNLTGGSRGTSSNSSFQDAFDALLKVRANHVVPLIDQDLENEGHGSTATVASVAAQLVDHVSIARGTAQNTAGERGGYIGFRGTKDEIIDQANAINDFDVHMVAQNPTVLDATGTLREFGPRILATMAASMRAGVPEVGEPLTFKFLRVSSLTQDNSWDPSELTDANQFIQNGILFAETIDGKGTRWVRDLTTHVKDDNLAFVEGSVRDAVRFIAFNLREVLVDRFTGKKAAPATITNIRDAAVAFLELARQDNIIVDSTDPTTGSTIRAWHNLKVFSSGDVVTLNVGIFPVPGINFQLNELFLQLPTQSA